MLMLIWLVYDEGTGVLLGEVEAETREEALNEAENEYCVLVDVVKTW